MKTRTRIQVLLAVSMAGLLGGCAVGTDQYGNLVLQPAPIVVAPQPVYVQSGPAVVQSEGYTSGPLAGAEPGVVEEQFDYVGEGTPLAFVAYPGVAFYPRYVEECLCIYNVAYYNGRWINHLGAPVVYHGRWGTPPRHIIDAHRNFVRQNPHAFTRMHPPGRVGGAHPGPVQHAGPAQHVPPQARPGSQARPTGQQQQPRVQQTIRPRQTQVNANAGAQRAPAPRAAAPAKKNTNVK